MKKKLLGILICGVLLTLVTGCGNNIEKNEEKDVKNGVNGQVLNSEIKVTIVNNDGKTEKKSWYELYELLGENNEYFRKYYDGAKIKIIDTIYSIKKDDYSSVLGTKAYEIVLSSGWYVYIDQNNNDLSDVLKGTKVEIESYIHDNGFWPTMYGKKSTIIVLSD